MTVDRIAGKKGGDNQRGTKNAWINVALVFGKFKAYVSVSWPLRLD